MATHFGILAWRIPQAEEPGRLQSTGLQRGRHDRATEQSHLCFTPHTCGSIDSPPNATCRPLCSQIHPSSDTGSAVHGRGDMKAPSAIRASVDV